jgi:ATP-dependent Lhr-like helicase
LELCAWTLLRRYGVVFKRLSEREPARVPWREMLRVLRRLEARGEIRGGRFVEGMAGEQFASIDAVGALREIRRRAKTGELVSLCGADPLNLTGFITPGERLPAVTGNRVLYRDGKPIAHLAAKEVKLLENLDPGAAFDTRTALLGRRMPNAAERQARRQ